MKTTAYFLTTDVMGRPAGSEVTLVHAGEDNHIVADGNGQHITAPVSALRLKNPEAEPEPTEEKVVAFSREPEIVPALEVSPEIEAEARKFYDDYCAAVGGVAHNGDPLPPSEVFFADANKQKQANAYRTAAGLSYERFVADAIEGGEIFVDDVILVPARENNDFGGKYILHRSTHDPVLVCKEELLLMKPEEELHGTSAGALLNQIQELEGSIEEVPEPEMETPSAEETKEEAIEEVKASEEFGQDQAAGEVSEENEVDSSENSDTPDSDDEAL